MDSLEQIRAWLTGVEQRDLCETGEQAVTYMAGAKTEAVRLGKEEVAKEIWCLQEAFRAQDRYSAAFVQLKAHKFYEAWCVLEQVEMTLGFLSRHFLGEFPRYRLDFIHDHVERWQGLYPYKLFMSPEIVEEEKHCSICGQRVQVRKSCGHRPGDIYGGEQCNRIVKPKLLGMSLVEHPVQKYSVPFLTDPGTGATKDHYNYSLAQFVIDRLRSPYDAWEVTWTKRRHPHARYKHIGRNAPCPCESGKKYKKCCLPESGVLRPHAEISFAVTPPPGVPMFQYTD